MGATVVVALLFTQTAELISSCAIKLAMLLLFKGNTEPKSIMKITLSEYLDKHGTQATLATALGVQQSAISQMLRAGRNIEITIHPNGILEANELRPIPARPKRKVA
ncbi:Cro/CI family transcriptional regulator [Pseudomonas luteola]|uniref:Cro/CI family transcriptional regulator n=1 Tax=Pseudomonas luteola TaxID=47886 RepID=UPI00289825E7|nr:Cro/CI family transcriptional regulator [Pseudomonas luteola]